MRNTSEVVACCSSVITVDRKTSKVVVGCAAFLASQKCFM